MKKTAIVALALFVVFGLGFAAPQFMSMQHYVGHMQDEAATGAMQHDEVNMPMLNGVDTAESEVSELRRPCFKTIRTSPAALSCCPMGSNSNRNKRRGAKGRFDRPFGRHDHPRRTGKNPQIPIQSLTLKTLFEGRDTIVTEIEITDYGIAIIQTSTDPKVVAALQEHALEVSNLGERGMDAVHEQMMKQHH
jgi:hypothetical protein